MNHTPLLRGTLLALVLVPVSACAKPADEAASPPAASASAIGGVTMAVFVNRHAKKLMAADTDGDGRISKAEFLSANGGHKGDPAKRFARMDTNGDGMLDKSEIDAMLSQRFRHLDTNGDGVLSADERAAGHAHRGKGRGDGAEI